MNGAESLIQTAVRSGIKICFANFGTSEVSLVAALDSIPGIKAVPALFEGVCTGAADGYARTTDKPAMVLLHLGVGLVNGLANLHNAKRARVPVVTVVGEHAIAHQKWDSIEYTDIGSLASPIAGWVRSSHSAQEVAGDTAAAIAAALRRQVAVLIVPQDCQWDAVESTDLQLPEFRPSTVDSMKISQAAEYLRDGSETLLLLGGKALCRESLISVARIQEAAKCDLLTETFISRMDRGGGLTAIERLPYFPEDAVKRLWRYRKVILTDAANPVGTFFYKDGTSRFLRDDQCVMSLADPEGDIEAALDALANELGASCDPPKAEPINRPEPVKGKLTPETVGITLAALQPEGAIIVEEAVTSAGPYYKYSKSLPSHSLLTLTGGAIGQGMPCSVGAAMGAPDRPVINFQADGCAMYTVQSLWTQAHEGLNVTTVLCSNRSYDILKYEMFRAGLNSGLPNARKLTNLTPPEINWVQLSESMGVPGCSANTAEEFGEALKRALSETGPHLIELNLAGA